MTFHPNSCLYCKHMFLDNQERAAIRLTNQLQSWPECLISSDFDYRYEYAGRDIKIETSRFARKCNGFIPCLEPSI